MKTILNPGEVKELQTSGDLMTKESLIDLIRSSRGMDISQGMRVSYLDYRSNPMAPEKFAYSLSWVCYITGKRTKCVFWPNTVGMQA